MVAYRGEMHGGTEGSMALLSGFRKSRGHAAVHNLEFLARAPGVGTPAAHCSLVRRPRLSLDLRLPQVLPPSAATTGDCWPAGAAGAPATELGGELRAPPSRACLMPSAACRHQGSGQRVGKGKRAPGTERAGLCAAAVKGAGCQTRAGSFPRSSSTHLLEHLARAAPLLLLSQLGLQRRGRFDGDRKVGT